MSESDDKGGQSLWSVDPSEGQSALEDVDPEDFDEEAVKEAEFDEAALQERFKPYRKKPSKWNFLYW